ncbi:hypothetical protein CLV90_3412 [Maribacter spongiicola]|uniref:Uncharacterized protein n=1 Tax=Maribacter spongiicola TaxID=1206753 RepID=A0A4R7JTB7_9FLAO|nr:hypothetical protein [Maribacter spongiicola]TDT40563.1 hypothetical protein CLV90_3412 [Maribacter spongiicola]
MNLKELLNIAKSELTDMTTLSNPDFRLEQAEFFKDEKCWEIVVSYLVENTNPKNSPLAAITSEFKYHRIYKKLKIDENKNVVGFFMWEN